VSPLRGERRDRPTYRILDRLSSGLGDDVFLAHHEIFDGRVVQKTVYMHGLEDALASNEPAFLNRLEHPRIVPVREAQWDPAQDRAITFVMPHLAGGSVHDALLEGYRFSIYQSIAIAIDALDALAYVHREFRALHRDTKPGNVLLDENRRHGYLSDFGSAAVIDDAGGAAAVLGTNVYRPPEARLTGRVTVDADIYGIGMMLFEMLNGRLPWEELDLAVVEARLQRGLRAVPDSALQFQAHVPERLRRCVRKATQRDSGQRYGSAEAFIAALRKVRCIDWRHAEGDSVEGVWFGTWPPQLRPEQRTEYRVITRALASGRDRGRIRVEADWRRPRAATWRQATPDATLNAGDVRALSAYFEQVEASAAHRSPAR
jgi:eukaryotic-like serine/threonine-protein kinase